MARPTTFPPTEPISNRILRLLPAAERNRLVAAGERLAFEQGDVFQEPGDEITTIYFPMSGVLSMLTILSSGQAVEVATIGKEGFAGLPVFLGARVATTRTVAQVAGEAIAVGAEGFRQEMTSGGRLAIILARYTELLFVGAAQSTACARLHSVEQRVARAILTWHDRLDREVLPVTQEALAEALGVRRAGVTTAISTFVGAGAMRRGRGRLYIRNRPVLDAFACECFTAIQQAFDREPS